MYTQAIARAPRALGEFGSIHTELDNGCVVESYTDEREEYNAQGVLFKYEFQTVLKNAQGELVRSWRTKTVRETYEAHAFYIQEGERLTKEV